MITPKTEVVLHIQNKKNPDNKNYFFSAKIREFEKIFPREKKLIEFKEQKKIVEELEKEKNNSLKLLEDQKKKFA